MKHLPDLPTIYDLTQELAVEILNNDDLNYDVKNLASAVYRAAQRPKEKKLDGQPMLNSIAMMRIPKLNTLPRTVVQRK